MANIRQYIGARYVFKIYENSQDPSSAEWESGMTYEPLTIVTYLNSTYASKKDVPGSVGDPASNPLYWVVTGAYNGQIATLQQQIDEINNTKIPSIESAIQTLTAKVSSLTNRYFLLLGDSYGKGYTPGESDIKGWCGHCQDYITNAGGRCYYNANNGGGFAVSSNWLSNLTNDLPNIPDKELVSDIIILGGSNDVSGNGVTSASLVTAMENTYTFLRTNFPNATIKVGILSAVFNMIIRDSANTYYNYCVKSAEIGYQPITSLRALYCNPSFVSSDGTHLTQAAYAETAPYVMQAILGECHFKFKTTTPVTYNSTNTEEPTGHYMTAIISNDRVDLYVQNSSNNPTYVKLKGDAKGLPGYAYQLCTIDPHIPIPPIANSYIGSSQLMLRNITDDICGNLGDAYLYCSGHDYTQTIINAFNPADGLVTTYHGGNTNYETILSFGFMGYEIP